MLLAIRRSAYADIQLVVLNDSFAPSNRGVFAKVVHNWNTILYQLCSKLDDRIFGRVPDALEPRDATELLRDIPVIRVTPRGSKHCDWFPDGDVERIKAHHIDVLVRLGFRILKGRILQAAPHGVWSYHHADNFVNRGGPPGLWEVLEGNPVTGSILQILSEDLDNGTVLCRSFSATDQLSVRRGQSNNYWKSASFLPRKLQQLHALGGAEFLRVNSHNGLSFYSRRLYVAPKNREFVLLLSKHLARYGTQKVRDLFFGDQRILLFDMADGVSRSLWRYKRIVPPRDRFWADPHVVFRDGKYYMFIEEFVHDRGKGHIAVIEMDEAGRYSRPRTVLERPYHLSYPFVFESNGNYYMIPETSTNQTVEVYRCVEFPTSWVFCTTLMQDVSAVDATLFPHGQKWWLFASIRERPGASRCDELCLFYADSPLSTDWTDHPGNPIVSDVRRSRPAGRIFAYNGQLYRPSQDSSGGYGSAVRINRLVTLSETEYREEETGAIEPTWARDIRGVHGLSHAHRLTVVDARLRRFGYRRPVAPL